MIIAMITSSDLDYKETKLIKQEKKVLKSPLKELADWINKEYGVKVINIYYDYIEDHRPRLNIIFEFETDERKFYDNDYNYNHQKQKAISKKFNKLLSINNNESKYNLIAKWFRRISFAKYCTKDLLVVFNSFEPIAREEANNRVPIEKVEVFKQNLYNKDLWKISKFFDSTTFFFYTDEQVKEYRNNGTVNTYREAYFDLLKPYDEFDYIKKESFCINVDSKENFDRNYKSTWFNYYR
jgi:hypothetical protein